MSDLPTVKYSQRAQNLPQGYASCFLTVWGLEIVREQRILLIGLFLSLAGCGQSTFKAAPIAEIQSLRSEGLPTNNTTTTTSTTTTLRSDIPTTTVTTTTRGGGSTTTTTSTTVTTTTRTTTTTTITTTSTTVTTTTQPGPSTQLDQKRCQGLRIADQKIDIEEVTPGDPDFMQPTTADWYQRYISKSLIIRALVDECGEDPNRMLHADALLRQAYIVRFPAQSDCSNVNTQHRWQHFTRVLALRELIWYGNTMAPDVRAGVEAYAQCHLVGPQTSSSENLRWGANSGRFLSHEYLGETNRSTHQDLRAWVINRLKEHLKFGFKEWGSNYSGGSLFPILNLAELSQDAEVRKLALAVVEMYMAQQGVHSLGVHFTSGRIRTYRKSWATNSPRPSAWARVFFGNLTSEDARQYTESVLTALVSNYSPLKVTQDIFSKPGGYEAKMRVPQISRSHYFYSKPKYAIGSIQNLTHDFFRRESVTHDVFPIFIQTKKGRNARVVPFGLPIENIGPSKIISLDERSFGYENMAFVHHGGDTKGVWTGGGVDSVPIRLFYGTDIINNPIIQNGWVFLQDGQGAYIAWAPTKGDPINANETRMAGSVIQGRFIRSTFEGPSGETAVIEVGDQETYGSFNAFRNDVISRNPRPREVSGQVTYVTKSQKTIVWQRGSFRVNGTELDATNYPLNQSPYLNDNVITINGKTTTINQTTGQITGATARIPRQKVFGNP